MKKALFIIAILFFLTGSISVPAAATNNSYYFLIVPQSDEPPIWRPSPSKRFPIINSEYLMELTEKHSFIEGIAAYQPELIVVGNSLQDKTQVINYCFNKENFLTVEMAGLSVAEDGDAVLISEQLATSLGLDKSFFPGTITKFVELFDPRVQSGAGDINSPPDYVSEQLMLHGIAPSYLKLSPANEFILTNSCALPSNEEQAETLRFDPAYTMPHTVFIKSSTSDVDKVDAFARKLSRFFADSRPGLRFRVQQVAE